MSERVRKPEWLKISIGANERYTETKRIVESHCLHTICSSGRCPNMGECWGKGTATFMIGGDICTRCCKFCNTQTGKPMPLVLLIMKQALKYCGRYPKAALLPNPALW